MSLAGLNVNCGQLRGLLREQLAKEVPGFRVLESSQPAGYPLRVLPDVHHQAPGVDVKWFLARPLHSIVQ